MLDDERGLTLDGKVVFLTHGVDGESFDPATGTWSTIATTCPILSGSSVAGGGTLAFGDLFAFDIATDTCYRLPDMHDRHRRGALYLWMGDRMLIWSGGRSEESAPGPDGITFQPTADDAS